jgi:hypothetical protein
MPRGPSSVPCGGCTLCCRSGELIVVTDEDVGPPGGYQLMQGALGEGLAAAVPGAAVLAQRADGACVYVTEGEGCAIHAWAPMVCQAFSCAGLYAASTRRARRSTAARDPSGYVKALYAQGRRMHELIGQTTMDVRKVHD